MGSRATDLASIGVRKCQRHSFELAHPPSVDAHFPSITIRSNASQPSPLCRRARNMHRSGPLTEAAAIRISPCPSRLPDKVVNQGTGSRDSPPKIAPAIEEAWTVKKTGTTGQTGPARRVTALWEKASVRQLAHLPVATRNSIVRSSIERVWMGTKPRSRFQGQSQSTDTET